MFPLWVLGHSRSRATLVNDGLRHSFILSGSWQRGSLAALLPRALPPLALNILRPSLAPRAWTPQELVVEPSLPRRQISPWCLGARTSPYCRAVLTSHPWNAGNRSSA